MKRVNRMQSGVRYLVARALFLLALTWTPLSFAAGTFADCRMNGGTEMCTQPIPSDWRYSNGPALVNPVPGTPAYCATTTFHSAVGRTPNEAYDKMIAIYSPSFISACNVDLAQAFTRHEDCNLKPKSIATFNSFLSYSPTQSPFNGKQVIQVANCSVNGPSISFPGQYYTAFPVYRQLTCRRGVAVASPTGEIWCVGSQLNDIKDQEQDGMPDCENAKGNPINTATGNKYQSEVDYVDAAGRLVLQRHFNSRTSIGGSAGSVWSTNFDARLDLESGGSQLWVVARRPDGAGVSFKPNGLSYVADSSDIRSTLSAVRDVSSNIIGWRFFDAESKRFETYDAGGRLTAYIYLDGYTQTLSYPSADALNPSSVIDSFGRSFTFVYGVAEVDDPSAIRTVTDPAGRTMTYGYGPNSFAQPSPLLSVTYPDGTVRGYIYDSANRLTGVQDEVNNRLSTFSYDTSGRAIGSERAGGAGAVYITPTVNTDGSISNTISDMGVTTTQSYVRVNGKLRLASQTQPAGSGCAAATSLRAYDTSGNVASIDDFNGNRACFDYNSRSLSTVLVEGASTSDVCSSLILQGAALPTSARKITTEWHPLYNLPIRIASPNRIVTYVYNGQPDLASGGAIASCASGAPLLPDGNVPAVLCKVVEQATTDLDGSQGLLVTVDPTVPRRENSRTYNAVGQVITQTDPLGNLTRYDYYTSSTATYTVGDLWRVTSPKGFVSTMTSYNKDGGVLTMSEADGSTMTYGYDTRGRRNQINTDGELMTITYYDTGLVMKVTYPDGAELNYGYDAAQRLTSITDKAGNSVTYTLRVDGQRASEDYKDSTGTLKRRIERTFDALNRMYIFKG